MCSSARPLQERVKILAIVFITLSAINTGASFQIFNHSYAKVSFSGLSFVWLAFNVLLLWGTIKRNKYYLLPWMIMTIVVIIACTILACFFIYLGIHFEREAAKIDPSQAGKEGDEIEGKKNSALGQIITDVQTEVNLHIH